MPTLRTGRSSKGFSLLELIVVIFILSLFAAVSLPSLSLMSESEGKSEAKRIASLVRYLSDSAASRKETYSLTVDLATGTFMYSGPDGRREETFRTVFGLELQSRGVLSEGEVTVFFTPLGASEALTFMVSDGNGTIAVNFNPFSGRVTVSERT